MNTFGTKFRLTTFGESHGNAIGGVLDGVPAGLKIDLDFIQKELNKRKPGGKFATSRKESDKIEILSGVFEGLSTGMPIGLIIYNENQKSKDYENVKNIFRPGHADFTYFHKFGIRDYRGGGRSSARESAIRVAGGAIAQLLLNELSIEICSGIYSVGKVNHNTNLEDDFNKLDFKFVENSEIFSLYPNLENEFKNEILKAKKSHDSIGGSVGTIIKNLPIGLGEVLYEKFDAKISEAMMGINAVKAVEIGSGVFASEKKGSQNNDFINKNGFLSNNSGGVLGGLTSGQDVIIKTHFKPTPSIFLKEKTIDIFGNEKICELKGRHDPCVAVRGSVVATAMARLVVADMLILNLSSKLDNIKKIYNL
ncbi:chorismate synthase [Campylobacter blaseri]|uniref:Chorismate synthase n=1 Tax=Campylobacter blaseri TaxID=2042961 RepID=A0A2P8R3L2_9BACT|nr:chorismate synthase [Campylobacter blaseri]PSM53096.1 chorismate synthase [Campylobacter blaseri]PSM54563.1 chorismate synthase [Campylobacter blaseri]QKF86966.1 chorismate synthase [Campylobacter blaseri]